MTVPCAHSFLVPLFPISRSYSVKLMPQLKPISCQPSAFQREELSAEGGRGAAQSQIQPHHPDLGHLQRTRVLLHSHRIHEQWLPRPAAPPGSYMRKPRALPLTLSRHLNPNVAQHNQRKRLSDRCCCCVETARRSRLCTYCCCVTACAVGRKAKLKSFER